MKIHIEIIPASEQRYDTCGDYWKDQDGVWQFRISDMHNLPYAMLVLIHELVEWTMCMTAGISMEAIDKFDMTFEKDRLLGLHSKTEEPGDHRDAPYIYQHKCATKVERLACKLFGIKWSVYDAAVGDS